MGLQNCWEFMHCGRDPGGARVADLGVCPASTLRSADGFCAGTNGGRACSYIAGTLCGGQVHGSAQQKAQYCAGCAFFQQLRAEHGPDFGVMSFAVHLRNRSA